MLIEPVWLLAALVPVLIVVRLLDGRRHRRGDARLSAFARGVKMNYSPIDRFDLAGRLRRSPAWRARSAGLRVSDVLYGAHGDERRFVATVTRRASPDSVPVVCVIACVERLSDGAFREVAPPIAIRRTVAVDDYRAHFAAWPDVAVPDRPSDVARASGTH